MSLINDALKKAKQAQAKAPVRESAPQLRSPETDHPVRSGPSLVWPAIMVAAGLVGAALVWVAMSGRKPDGRKVEPVAAGNPAAPASNPEQAVAFVGRDVVATPASAVPVAPPTTEPKPVIASSATVVAPPAAAPAPAPALPKLNGIFFNPTKPTAIVNNKLVSAGSRVGEFTVMVITQNSVTLASDGQTNVLSLSE